MLNIKKTVLHWSGGKDCAIALHKLQQSPRYSVMKLFTAINRDQNRVTMHGVRRELIERQAREIGLPITIMELPDQPGMEVYNRRLKSEMNRLKKEGITHAAFGDIFLEDLKTYRENQMQAVGLRPVFPLWQMDTKKLIRQFIDHKFRAYVVSVQGDKLKRNVAGQKLDDAFVNNLPDDVNPCGENGEFHTFVYDGPIFSNPVSCRKGELTYRDYKSPQNGSNKESTTRFWFREILPA